jgi:hypothetical protein
MVLQSLLAGLCRDRWVPRKGYKVLTSKIAPRSNKGRGARSTGVHLKDGRFFILPQRMPRIMMPDLTDCKVRGEAFLVCLSYYLILSSLVRLGQV